MSFVFTLLGLGFVIFIHELGHLLAAKRARVGVSEFAVGMGPKLWSFQYNETEYSLRLLPFGGFIKAKGLDDMEQCAIEEDFREKGRFDRALILAAGSLMNLVLGFFIFVAISAAIGNQVLQPEINQVMENYPAKAAGIRPGDIITHVNQQVVSDVSRDIISVISESNGDSVTLTIERDNESNDIQITPQASGNGGYVVGISFSSISVPTGLFSAIKTGAQRTGATIVQSVGGLKMLILGQASIKDLAGPVGIIQIASSQIEKSWVSFFSLMAFISISLGIINLFPFPILDGGHLLFLLIEIIRGRPLNKKIEGVIHQVSTMILVGLMAFIIFNDVVHWNDRVNLIKGMNQ
jgi:regulator of sigma E protease